MTTRANRQLRDFATWFIADIDDANDVRSEHLAEALRSEYGLANFPTLPELRRLCLDLGIPLHRLADLATDLHGGNIAYGDEVAVFLRSDLSRARTETTLCHELREALENTFKYVKPEYRQRVTSSNQSMNPISDRFAGYLLMSTGAARPRLRALGYDVAAFARETGRSLPSVIRRSQQLFSKDVPGPVMGVWLFDAPWQLVREGAAAPEDFTVKHQAKLCGFTQSAQSRAKHLLPSPRSTAADFNLTRAALQELRPLEMTLNGAALSPILDYAVVVEPFTTTGGLPWRLLLTAVRLDALSQVRQWRQRLRPLQRGSRLETL